MRSILRPIDLFKPHLRPRLVIIGAQKAGTSSLYAILRHHPKVLAPRIKEQHFFDDDLNYAKGLAHYWAQFPKRPFRQPDMITFEATPSYLFKAGTVAPRLKAALPDAFLLVILRDPVKRAYSGWNMYRSFKDHPKFGHLYDERDFEQAIHDELEGRRTFPGDYLSRGHYAQQLAIYFQHYPRERILVHDFVQLKRDPRSLMAKICHAIGIPVMRHDHFVLGVKANARVYSGSMDRAMEDLLYSYYAPELDRLEMLLGRRLGLDERNNRA